ncbi:MAG: hypothetical protein NZV14_00160 [Bryobacteraceae bacterium]|nr:hypothetical protein [Bryobacteraceae bacterium]MDW8376544.1 hypothetical protein [Bryobacterales bacterium]
MDVASNGGLLDVTTGGVRLSTTAGGNTASVLNLATNWANQINSGAWAPASRNLRILQHNTIQNLVYEESGRRGSRAGNPLLVQPAPPQSPVTTLGWLRDSRPLFATAGEL